MHDEWFLNDKFKSQINNKSECGGELVIAFANCIKELLTKPNQSVVSPNDLKYAVGRRAPMFMGYNQQDSMELCRFMLDGLHEDLNRVQIKPKYKELQGEGDPKQIAREWWDYHNGRDDSIITDYFRGQLISTITC